MRRIGHGSLRILLLTLVLGPALASAQPPGYGTLFLKNGRVRACAHIERRTRVLICEIAEGRLTLPRDHVRRVTRGDDLAALEYARMQIRRQFRIVPPRVDRIERLPANQFRTWETARFEGRHGALILRIREDLQGPDLLQALRHELGHVYAYRQRWPDFVSESVAILFAGNVMELTQLAGDHPDCNGRHMDDVRIWYACAAQRARNLAACLDRDRGLRACVNTEFVGRLP